MNNETPNMPMRRIVNSNIGVTNIIEEQDVKSTIVSTFKELSELLKAHCGPFSKYAIISDPLQAEAEPIFTKDGINIVRAIEYASPIQEFVKKNLAYIGSRIETAASDGTTSAMIITAEVLTKLIDDLGNLPVSNYTLEHLFKENIVNKVKELYNDGQGKFYKYTKEKLAESLNLDIKDVIYYLAYSQVYTSSHGDVELAKAVANLFKNTPEEAWAYMHIEKAQYETKEKYKTVIESVQWHIENARLFPLDKMIDDFGTTYKQDDIECCVITRTPSLGDAFTEPIRDHIENKIISGDKYLYICSDKIDVATTNWLNNLFTENPSHNVVFILVPDGEYGMNNDVSFIPLMKGILPTQENYFDHIKCKFDSTGFDIIKGLYQDDDTSSTSRMHFYLKDKDKYKVYNDTVNYLDQCINAQKKVVASRQSNAALSHLMKIRNKLTIINRASFIIGGSAYDNAAAVDIVTDAIPAVKHILTEGFVQASFKSLYRALDTIHKRDHVKDDSINSTIIESYTSAFCCAIEKLNKHLLESTESSVHDYFLAELNEDLLSSNNNKYKVEELVASKELQEDNIVIMQPVNTDITLLERFGEMALKFIKACRVITPGGVVLHNNK